MSIALWVGIAVVILGVMPGIFCREPFRKVADKEIAKEKTGPNGACSWLFQGFWRHIKKIRHF